jgi:hypothetical protein
MFLALAAIPAGEAVRGDASPFVWQALANPHTVRSTTDSVLTVVMYAAFYLLGFVLPYWIITFILFVRRRNAARWNAVTIPLHHRRARLFACTGVQIMFLLFLRPIVYFIRGLPEDNWMLWPWMFGVALAAFFLYAAYSEFTHPQPSPRSDTQQPRRNER